LQISDSHIGFHLPLNPDPGATLTEAVDKIKAMPTQPAFLVHTGDISHLSKEEEWDVADLGSDWHQVRCDPGKGARRWGRRHPGGRGRVWDLSLAVFGSNSRRLRYCLCTCRMKRHSGGSGYLAVGPAGQERDVTCR